MRNFFAENPSTGSSWPRCRARASTPEAIVGDPGVRAGFLASGMMASMFRALAPFGFVRFLLALATMPLYPEQGLFRAQVTDEDYRYWTAAVCRDFAGAASSELRSVLPAAVEAQRRRAGLAAPELGDLPLGVLTSRAWGQKWVDMHRELATRSRSSFHRITGDRSHNIHMRHAALIIDFIREVASADKARKAASDGRNLTFWRSLVVRPGTKSSMEAARLRPPAIGP